ncbi:MAG: hypothetical protein JWM91_4288 [Rhodospirillales bacterium]|nr:hypothetical protein [Rhodospirillales bacterium]
MTPAETQLYLPLLIMVAAIALMGRRMMRPRRFRLAFVWIGPVLALAGAGAFFAIHPAPTPIHAAALAVITVLGAAFGWARARLIKVAYDPETNNMTRSGTPYGILLLVALILMRSGLRIVALQHPELGIDLTHAPDILLFFGVGIVSGYAVELHRAVGRVRRATL